MVYILSFVMRIQLKNLHDIIKSVFLIVTKFWSDTTSHCSVVPELRYAILRRTNKDITTIFSCMRDCHLWQCLDE